MIPDRKEETCTLNEAPFYQCCCNCEHHWQDNHHCTTAPGLRELKHGCICGERKGWICVGMRLTQPGCEKTPVNSGWPEHSIGCEMYTPIVLHKRSDAASQPLTKEK